MAKFIEVKVETPGRSTYSVTVNIDYIINVSDNDHYRFVIMYNGDKYLTKETYKELITRLNS